MRTEAEWAKFAKYVPVGARVQFRGYGHVLNGVLLENYPHHQREHDKDATHDCLQVKFDRGEIDDILADYEYFRVSNASYPDDDTWYRFDDIMMFDDEAVQS